MNFHNQIQVEKRSGSTANTDKNSNSTRDEKNNTGNQQSFDFIMRP